MSVIRRRLLLLVVIAIHLAGYVVAAAVGFGGFVSEATAAACFVFLLSQQALLFIWGGLATRRWPPSLLIAYVLACGMWMLPTLVGHHLAIGGLAGQGVATAVMMMCVVVPLRIARARGYRLQRFRREELPQGTGFQITIRGLLLVTALVAGMLAIGQIVEVGGVEMSGASFIYAGPPNGSSWNVVTPVVLIAGVLLLFAASAVLGVWASLSTGTVWSRMLVHGLTLVGAGAFLPYLFHGDFFSYCFWGALPLASFLVVSLTLLTFRAVGYRFLRSEISTAKDGPSYPDALPAR